MYQVMRATMLGAGIVRGVRPACLSSVCAELRGEERRCFELLFRRPADLPGNKNDSAVCFDAVE